MAERVAAAHEDTQIFAYAFCTCTLALDARRPLTTGTSGPNFISADDGRSRLRAPYGDQRFARLVALEDIYDPDKTFALDLNLALPTAALGYGVKRTLAS